MEITPFEFITSGESHGEGITVTVPFVPAGIPVSEEDIRNALTRRRRGYGRGPRMKLEEDRFVVTGGLRGGVTTGNPFSVLIYNTEREKWRPILHPFTPSEEKTVTRPRPGHADFAGAMKFLKKDIRDVIERTSARETAGRVIAGVVARNFLKHFGIEIVGYVTSIGGIKASVPESDVVKLKESIESSELACPDREAEEKMKAEIDKAREEGDTVGGTFTIVAFNVPPGLGSYAQWFSKLDARLAAAVMSVPGVKGVEIGAGFRYAEESGSHIHDEILPATPEGEWWEGVKWFKRLSNNAGGIEGGVSNGENIVIRAVMKPIPTLRKPLRSIDILTREAVEAHYERSDVCVVPAACFVAESMVAVVLAKAFVEKFGGDTLTEIERTYSNYLEALRGF